MGLESGPLTPNQEYFKNALTAVYADLFANDPEYAYSASRITPAELADKMTRGILSGSANHTGTGIRRACKKVGIKHTRKAMCEFFTASAGATLTGGW